MNKFTLCRKEGEMDGTGVTRIVEKIIQELINSLYAEKKVRWMEQVSRGSWKRLYKNKTHLM
jgi:isocitrate dehydrogenase